MLTEVRVDDTAGVGGLIRSARTHAGLTQAELAARIGTKQSVVSRWERGGGEPRLATLARIMRACGFALTVGAQPDDVDRAQIQQHLALTPVQRLASVRNVSRALASVRRAD